MAVQLVKRRPVRSNPDAHYRKFSDRISAGFVPPQEVFSPGPDPGFPPPFLEMANPRTDECIVRDIGPSADGSASRWTNLDPALKFYLRERKGLRFAMDFTVIGLTFKDTGPVVLSCYINDRFLAKIDCPRPGDYHFEHPVPDAWLQDGNPAVVRAVLDKVWTAPEDGVRLGYLLFRAGFISGQP
jgi:hypothetical protein